MRQVTQVGQDTLVRQLTEVGTQVRQVAKVGQDPQARQVIEVSQDTSKPRQ